jgi:hypothetical protein
MHDTSPSPPDSYSSFENRHCPVVRASEGDAGGISANLSLRVPAAALPTFPRGGCCAVDMTMVQEGAFNE